MTVYLAICSIALVPYIGAPWWTALIGTLVLTTKLFYDQRALQDRFYQAGAIHLSELSYASTLLHSFCASAAAFALGYAVTIGFSV